jgi:hypothetical protein
VEMKHGYAFILSESRYPLSNSAMFHMTSVVANLLLYRKPQIFYRFDILSFAAPFKLIDRNSVIPVMLMKRNTS